MQFNIALAFTAVLVAAVPVFATPAPAPQPGCSEVFFPDTCPAGQIVCAESGAIMICCPSCP